MSVFRRLFEEAPAGAPVRGLLVSAEFNQLKPALDYTRDEFRNVIDVNLIGSFLCAPRFRPGVYGSQWR